MDKPVLVAQVGRPHGLKGFFLSEVIQPIFGRY